MHLNASSIATLHASIARTTAALTVTRAKTATAQRQLDIANRVATTWWSTNVRQSCAEAIAVGEARAVALETELAQLREQLARLEFAPVEEPAAVPDPVVEVLADVAPEAIVHPLGNPAVVVEALADPAPAVPVDPTRCGACTRKGTPCAAPRVSGKRRCKLHGGRSTGARSPEGRERSLAALARGRAVVLARRSTPSTPVEG